MRIPYIQLGLQHAPIMEELLDKTREVLSSGMFILGEEVKQFEETFAKLSGTKYAVGLNNGTDALILAMRAVGIGKGDEVITAPNSFLASASSIALTGASPVFADVRSDFNLDPKKVEAAITKNTKAIMPVHLTGRPADMDAIMAIAKKHNLVVIEDAAQAVGARYNGKPVGGIGNFGCFSLHPLKNLSSCGDGGMITTNSEVHYQWLLKARNHGLKSRDECEFWSMNSRLDAMQAALLNVKIKHLEKWNNRRREIAGIYQTQLKECVEVPVENEKEHSVYHTFIIKTSKRDALQKYLQENGIDSKVHYPIPIHFQQAAEYLNYPKGSFPETEKQVLEILSLPIYPELTDEQIQYICRTILAFFGS